MNYIRALLTLSMLLGAAGCGYFGSTIYHALQESRKNKEIELQKAIDKGSDAVADKVQAVYTIAETINRFVAAKKSIAEIEAFLHEVISKNNILISCGIVYTPYTYDPQQQFVSRRVVKVGQEFFTYAIDVKENYTNTDWYRNAQSGIPYWSVPFFDDISKQMIVRYSYPFYITDYTTQTLLFGGVINVAIPIQELDTFVLEMSLDKTTYAILIHQNGTILAHPTEIVVYEEKSILNLAREPGNKNLLQIYNLLKSTDEGKLLITNGIQNNTFKTMFKKVPKTSWYLILMHLENTTLISSSYLFKLFVLLLIALVVFVTSLLSLFFFYFCSTLRAAWFMSSLCAFLLATSIAGIWALDINSDIPDIKYENIIDTEYALQRFLFLEKKNNPHIYKKESFFIPTGIYITSFETGHDGSIVLSGQIWQKYDRAKDKTLEPSIVFLNATEQSTEKIYTTYKGQVETIGWWFKATFQANFNYLKYPFDEQQIVIMLGHKEYLTNVILTPDFEAFVSNASPKAEINPAIKSNQWIIQQSYSFYELTNFTTDFGIEGYNSQKGFPILNFGIRIRRQFVYPLTASALPVTIILFVVFSILLFTGLTEHHTSLATEIIKLTSSIFFATAVAHQTFQRSLQSSVITYFEYFYFLIYAIILLVAINGMLYAYNRGGTLISTHNNLIPRLLYWPVVLLLCLILTLFFFY